MIKDKEDDELIAEHVFQNEENVLHKVQEILNGQEVSQEDLRKEYQALAENYAKLLEDVKLLTKVSDKLQNKLHQINESLMQKTVSLEQAQKIIQDQNEELKLAKTDLENIVAIRTQDLNKAYEDLLIINKELDSFVYRASHDLRGPLATFLGLCYVAKLEVTDAQALDYFEKLNTTARKMDEILNKLLSINKLKNTSVSFIPLDLHALVQKVVASTLYSDSFRDVSIPVDSPGPLFIYSDKEVLEALLMNVLENAANSFFLAPEERTSTEFIHLELSEQAGQAVIVLRYKGIVIPAEHKEKIFEIFHRIHHRSDITGLRLYAARLAAEKLRGQVVLLESKQEHTSFQISLPLSPDLHA